MLESYEMNHADPFLKGWYIDGQVCDDLISYFESSPNKSAGMTYNGTTPVLREDWKKSTDLSIVTDCGDTPFVKYTHELEKVVTEYKNLFPVLGELDHWGVTERINIQRYLPNEGFFAWHSERQTSGVSKRLLVFNTYLNDVFDGGTTEWFHQKLSIQPQKGLTIIFPADWMYTHRGVTSQNDTKYIATGWISFVY
jgi:hypothetical protein